MTTTKTQANISLQKKKERKWKERKEQAHVDDFVSQGQNGAERSRVLHGVCSFDLMREKTEQL